MSSALDLASLRAEIEAEREWREQEMRLLRNTISALPNEADRLIARKALVVMLYAHFEGCCKSILSIYVHHINSLSLRVSNASPALAAAALTRLFSELRDPNRKNKIFANSLPDDTAFHRFCRERDFIQQAWKIAEHEVRIDADAVVDTESNLKPIVLRKILYRLGLDPELAQPWEATVHQLLNRRNNIAHGADKAGVDAALLEALERDVGFVIDGVVAAIMAAVSGQSFLATSWADS